MNSYDEEQEAQRLKQILFPRKARNSRSSVNSSLYDSKENIQMNRTYTVKQQIFKLKQGIQNFMQKQPFAWHTLSTPRQCLQLIKCMGDNMRNYGEQIEQAVNTLIESIPPPLAGTLPSSKYFIMQLKFSYLNSLFHTLKRKILGKCFTSIKLQAEDQKHIYEKQKQYFKLKQQSFNNYVTNKMHLAFNRWRINSHLIAKQQFEQYTYQNKIVDSLKTIKFISDESRIVLWLQNLIQSNANAIQILLLNQKNGTLRSYKLQSQSFGSVFQSVQNQSRISNGDESCFPLNAKIKQVQINLQHSLTKICLVKKQTLAIQELRKDPDYSRIDDFSSAYGQSARELPGGCIFTPIVVKNKSIGIIRQYFYDKIGVAPRPDIVSKIAFTLECSMKTSLIFEQIKQKTHLIRNKSYLKAVLFLNSMQKIQNFSIAAQEQLDRLFLQYFNIKFQGEYFIETLNTLDKFPRYTVTLLRGSGANLTQILSSLSKMNQSQSSYIYHRNTLFIKVSCKIFTFQASKQENGQLQHLPITIISQLLQKTEQTKDKKKRQYNNYLELKQMAKKEQIDRNIAQNKNKILQYLLSIKGAQNSENVIEILEQYTKKFIHRHVNSHSSLQIAIVNKNKNKQIRNSFDFAIYEDQNLNINLIGLKMNEINLIPPYILESLRDLSKFLIQKLKTPHILKFDARRIKCKAEIYFKNNNLQNSMKNLLINSCQMQSEDIKVMLIDKAENPFNQQNYHCWIDKKYGQLQNPQLFMKSLKMYSTITPTGLNILSTVVCIGGQMIIILQKYFDINQKIVLKLDQIYQYWKQQKQIILKNTSETQNSINIIKGMTKITRIILGTKLKQIYYLIKNSKIKVRYIPNLLTNYIIRQNKKALNFTLETLKSYLPIKKIKSISNIEQGIKLLSTSSYRLTGAKKIFNQFKIQKNKIKTLNRFYKIMQSQINKNKLQGFNQIYLSKYIINVNNLSIIEQIFSKVSLLAFENIKKFAKTKQFLSIQQQESECSRISKLDNLKQIAKIIQEKYQNLQTYLYLKNGRYLALSSSSAQIYDQINRKIDFQHFQFACFPKSPIKSVVWLVPFTKTLTLVQKHCLQVVSKAIDLGFKKFLCKNQEFIFNLNSFLHRKNMNLLNKGLSNLLNFTMNIIKQQQYAQRNAYYEANIEVQNYKIMKIQQRRQEQQRAKQIYEALEVKRNQQQNLHNYRKKIVRLEVSCRHLEQNETKSRVELVKKQIERVFNCWRLETAGHKREKYHNKLQRKQQFCAINSVINLLKNGINKCLRFSFKMLIVKSAEEKARITSNNVSNKKNCNKMNALQQIDQNRLLTFQDQFEQCNSDYQGEGQYQNRVQKQINIIPISFKHFESSKKQNYDVTDQEAKKVNGGAYKLNAKTLKFLKRMGKLNN